MCFKQKCCEIGPIYIREITDSYLQKIIIMVAIEILKIGVTKLLLIKF